MVANNSMPGGNPTINATPSTTDPYETVLSLDQIVSGSSIGLPLLGYEIYDAGSSNGAVLFDKSGMPLSVGSTNVLSIAPGDLSSTTINFNKSGTETFYVRDFNANGYSAWTLFQVHGTFQAPTVTTTNAFAYAGQQVGMDTLVQTTAGTLPVSYYDVWEPGGNGGGILRDSTGQPIPIGQHVRVAASDLANTKFTMQTLGRSSFYVTAYDSEGNAGTTQLFQLTTEHNPAVTASSSTVASGTQVTADTLIQGMSNTTGHPIVSYEIYDAGGQNASGSTLVDKNGAAVATGTHLTVAAADLASTTLDAGIGRETLYVRDFDGTGYSGWSLFQVTGQYHAPTVTASSQFASAGTILNLSSVASGTPGQSTLPITQYEIYESGGNGGATLYDKSGNAIGVGQHLIVAAGDLSSTHLNVLSSGRDTFFIRASDALGSSSYSVFQVTATAATV